MTRNKFFKQSKLLSSVLGYGILSILIQWCPKILIKLIVTLKLTLKAFHSSRTRSKKETALAAATKQSRTATHFILLTNIKKSNVWVISWAQLVKNITILCYQKQFGKNIEMKYENK